jgi:hypothetical protein
MTNRLRPTQPSLRADCVGSALAQEVLSNGKSKKKLTPVQKRAKKKAKEERQKKYMWVFRNGKQVRVKRPETIDGFDSDEFIKNNADPIWLHQNEMWEYMEQGQDEEMKPFIYYYCGQWKDGEGNMLFIEPVNDRQVMSPI